MKNSKKILIAITVVIGLLFILPFMIPLQTYLHQAEKIAREKLGQPITIGSAHALLMPSPRLIFSDIVVGAHQELKVTNLVVIPTIGSLFSDTKIIDLNISKPEVKKAAFDFVAALKTSNNSSSSFKIRLIKIEGLQLLWPNVQLSDTKFPIINADATLTNANALEQVNMRTVDGKLNAVVTPNDDEHLIVVSESKWTLPAGLPLLINKAAVQMHLKGSRLTISNMDIALYGGKLKGNAVVS